MTDPKPSAIVRAKRPPRSPRKRNAKAVVGGDHALAPAGAVSLDKSGPSFLCKHVAAALYGAGARLDHQPELLFLMRGVDAGDLLPAGEIAVPTKRRPGKGRVLEADDLSAVFGLDIADTATPKLLARRP